MLPTSITYLHTLTYFNRFYFYNGYIFRHGNELSKSSKLSGLPRRWWLSSIPIQQPGFCNQVNLSILVQYINSGFFETCTLLSVVKKSGCRTQVPNVIRVLRQKSQIIFLRHKSHGKLI